MAAISINFNATESFALGRLGRAQRDTAQSLERLSTGKRINRASDDPAGLVASEGLKSEREGVLRKIESYGQDLARYGALEGGLEGVGDLLTRLQGNITTAANSGALGLGERKALQLDTDALVGGIIQTVLTTRFKGELLLAGYLGDGAEVQVPGGDEAGGTPTRVNVGALLRSFASGGANNLLTGDLGKAQETINGLVETISSQRAVVGGEIRRVETLTRELASRDENLAKAISGIVDADIAQETAGLVRNQIVEQATLSAVQIARDLQKQAVVELLRGSVEASRQQAERAA